MVTHGLMSTFKWFFRVQPRVCIVKPHKNKTKQNTKYTHSVAHFLDLCPSVITSPQVLVAQKLFLQEEQGQNVTLPQRFGYRGP